MRISAPQVERWQRVMGYLKDPRFGTGWSRSAKAGLSNVFARLIERGRIGRLVLDAGSSWSSLAVEFGYANRGRYTVVGLDVGFDRAVEVAAPQRRGEPPLLRVRGDLSDLASALKQGGIQGWLEQRGIPEIKFNTVLLSDVLNYVDFQRVIISLRDEHLAPSGRIVTCNMAGVVFKHKLAHSNGVKNNSDLLAFMRKSGMIEEEVHHPISGKEFTTRQSDISRQILVFRKN